MADFSEGTLVQRVREVTDPVGRPGAMNSPSLSRGFWRALKVDLAMRETSGTTQPILETRRGEPASKSDSPALSFGLNG